MLNDRIRENRGSGKIKSKNNKGPDFRACCPW